MLDDVLNQEKHAPENPQVKEKEGLGNDEPVSLDTKEVKYVSYFSRIKTTNSACLDLPNPRNKGLPYWRTHA